MRIELLVSTVLGLAPIASAQVDEAWSTTLDRSPTSDLVHDGFVDPFGTTTIVGSRIPSPGDHVATIARVDAFSSVIFERDFVLPGATTQFLEIEPDGQDGFYARGSTVDTLGVASALLVRYDADGIVLWSVTDATIVAKDVAVDPSGDVWVVGNSGADVGIRRYTSSGTLLAATTWDSGGPDGGNAIAPDGLGGAYVAGWSNAVALVLKLDSNANVVWSRTSASSYAPGAQCVVVGPSGDVYVGGTFSMVLAPPKYAVAAFGPDGSLLWWNQPQGAHPGAVTHLAIDGHGDIVAGGATWFRYGFDGEVVVRKFTPAGVVQWTVTSATTGPAWEEIKRMVLDQSGDVFVVGEIGPSIQPLYTDVLVMRIDRDGVKRWVKSFGTAGQDDVGTAVGVSAPGTVFVGANVADGADTDVRVVRYDESIAPYCFGDGSGTACPCGNDSTAWDRAGCTNSIGGAGRLDGTGTASLASDTLVLGGSGMPNTSALYFQGAGAVAGGAGAVFGDGLRCASGPNVRLATRANVGGASSYPSAGEAPVSARGGVVVPGERTYQVWYRNVASFCTSAPFNLTNGVRVTWGP